MNLPLFIAVGSSLLFGILAIFFSIREEKAKHRLLEKEQKQKQRLLEISVLKEIQERIGYELDLEKVTDVITGSLSNLFPFSTTSSLLLKDEKLVFKTYVTERVSQLFIQEVKKSMIASLAAITGKTTPKEVEDVQTGILLDNTNLSPVTSFFHIPLVVDNEVVGIINIASTKPGLYREEEMTALYQITALAGQTITRLHHVLATEKGKLLSMIGSLNDGVFMVDMNKEILVINQSAKTMLNVSQEEPALVDILTMIGATYPLNQKIDEVIQTKQQITEKEIVLFNRILRVILNPVHSEAGADLIGVSVLFHDITLEKNLIQMKDDFTNMIIHELRAPLTAIRGASGLMADKTKPLNADEQHKLLQITHDQSVKLLDLVATLLDAAKLESGKFTIQKTPTDLIKTIDQSLTIFTPQAQGKQVTLIHQYPPQLPPVPFDSSRMTQVLNNLLSNSLKFTPEGGSITVTVEETKEINNAGTEGPNVKYPFVSSGSSVSFVPSVRVSVRDTGIGISKEQQEQLFSKFYQVQHEKKDLHFITAGTGLGLYIVKGIVEAHGGTVGVDSEEDKGTTIWFTLPLQESKQAAAEPTLPKPSQIFNTIIN